MKYDQTSCFNSLFEMLLQGRLLGPREETVDDVSILYLRCGIVKIRRTVVDEILFQFSI